MKVNIYEEKKEGAFSNCLCFVQPQNRVATAAIAKKIIVPIPIT